MAITVFKHVRSLHNLQVKWSNLVRPFNYTRHDGNSVENAEAGAGGGDWYGGCTVYTLGTQNDAPSFTSTAGHLSTSFTQNCMVSLCYNPFRSTRVILSKLIAIPS